MPNFAQALYLLVKTWTAQTYPTAFSYHGEQNDTKISNVFVVERSAGVGNCIFLRARGWGIDRQVRKKIAIPRGYAPGVENLKPFRKLY